MKLIGTLLLAIVLVGTFPQPSTALLDLSTLLTSVNLVDATNLTKTTISSLGPDVKRAQQYVYIAGATYCADSDVTAWTCVPCKKATGQAFSALLTNSTTNTQAVVTINTSTKEIVVAFRGTYNVANALQDVYFIAADPGYNGNNASRATSNTTTGIKVHSGFLLAANSLYPQTVTKLSQLLKANPGYSVVIIGHSLGAAMANLVLYMLLQKLGLPSDFPTPGSYSFFGYGEPRVGNQAYADFWNSQNIQVTRVVNKGDIVAHVPVPAMGFIHHGTELWINVLGLATSCSKTVYEDPKCSKSLGPLYNPVDHLQYWGVSMSGVTSPAFFLENFIVPLTG